MQRLCCTETPLSFAQQGTSQSDKPPQGNGIPSKPPDIEHPTSPIAGSPGLTVQEAITGKHADMDPMVHRLPTANPKLSGAPKRKPKKARAGHSGTGGHANGTRNLALAFNES